MSQQNKGLGRGLDALFRPNETEPAAGAGAAQASLSINLIDPNPRQPRRSFSEDGLKELAASIGSQGVLQPVLIRPAAEPGRYEIIAGERRWRAARMAGLAEIPVVIRESDDGEALLLALIENVQREDLNPVERARALLSVKETLGASQEELAERVGQSRSAVSNLLRILNLPERALAELASGTISLGHARCLAGISSQDAIEALLDRILARELSVRETERAAGCWRDEGRFPWEDAAPAKRLKDPEMARLAKDIGATLNCRAKISGTSEKGRISLAYASNEQLFELLEKLGLSLEP